MPRSVFISSPGTSSGKTFVARGLAARYRQLGFRVAGIKPIETGCAPDPADALALARAAGAPNLATGLGLYRARAAVAPYAAALLGESAPSFGALIEAVQELVRPYEVAVVEGAGGLLVPIDSQHDIADLARALAFPVLLAAPNRLGVLSHVRSAVESATRRGLTVAAIVLTEPDRAPDASSSTNACILRERLEVPIVSFPFCSDEDEALADAAELSALRALLD